MKTKALVIRGLRLVIQAFAIAYLFTVLGLGLILT